MQFIITKYNFKQNKHNLKQMFIESKKKSVIFKTRQCLRLHLDFEPTLLKSQKYGKTDASMSKSLFPFKFAQVYKMTVLMFLLKTSKNL